MLPDRAIAAFLSKQRAAKRQKSQIKVSLFKEKTNYRHQRSRLLKVMYRHTPCTVVFQRSPGKLRSILQEQLSKDACLCH